MAGANSNTFQHVLNVASLSALAAVHVAPLDEGVIAWVSSQQEPYYLTTVSSLTPNGVDVIQPLAGAPRAGKASALWIAQSTLQASSALLAAYVIDPVNGSDANLGSSASPLKTLTEWATRVSSITIAIAMTVTILSDLNAGDEPVALLQIGSTGSLIVTGASPTVLTSGTFTAVTQCAPATNTPYQVTDAAQGNANFWASYIADGAVTGKRIRVTSGANAGNVLWPAKNLGAKAARVSAPMVPDPTLAIYLHAQGAIAATNPYVVEQLVKVQRIDLSILVSRATPFVGPPIVQFRDLCILKESTIATSAGLGYDYPEVAFYGCDVGALSVGGSAAHVDCRMLQLTLDGTYSIALAGLAPGVNLFIPRTSSNALVDLRFMAQGDGLFAGTIMIEGAGNNFGQIQVFDAGGRGIDCSFGSGVAFVSGYSGTTELFGNGSTAQGVNVGSGTLALRSALGTFAITGAAGDVRVGSATKTWGQIPFIQSDIAAGSGTTFAGMISY